MAPGVSAVVGSTGALPEIGLGAAITVDAEDTEMIASGLESLLADEGLRRKLGEEGRRRAKGYTWASSAEQVHEVLRRAARAPQVKAA